MQNQGQAQTRNKIPKDQYMAHNAQNKEQQKIFNLQDYFDWEKLKNIQSYLQQFIDQLSKIKGIPINVQQQCKDQLDNISKLIQDAQNKIHSLSKENEDTWQTKFKQQPFNQTPQNKGDSDPSQIQISSIIIQTEAEGKNIQQQDVVNVKHNQQNKPQGCIIDLLYAKNNQTDYQFMLYLLMEQNLKINKLSLQCLGNVNIKRSDLTTLSNKNKFDLLLNYQLEQIFSNIKRKTINNELTVINCSNSFCNFKCFENAQINNIDKIKIKSYCPICEQQSVGGIVLLLSQQQ
ncbi:unnamed protein product (macronuclear) [Paramecium tetraurelia]|uniref:Uncharacterized protein n=1 Tax=Paramecium tetraurelia TaxID=5888 RepID=A0E6D4_PARTE|nr:uncharacterized protein GSPATT00003716001 [Paramecium tetraurelia]CAK90851.1 unnamed protein product [Paramecium tetraurelia]|eukprot:XP_001458248.1 hypothetical protein (macronuclear) [Paramecium tetraurelia strain d4-2]